MFGQRHEKAADLQPLTAVQGGFLDYLVQHGLVDGPGAERAKGAHANSREPIDSVLVELGILQEATLADALARHLNVDRIETSRFPIELPDRDMVPHEFLRSNRLLPIELGDEHVIVASSRLLDGDSVRALGYFLGRQAIPVIAVASELRQHLKRLLDAEGGSTPVESADSESRTAAQEDDIERLRDIARDAPVIKLLNRLIVAAIDQKASDIHIEPLADHVRVRMRIDGALQAAEALPKQIQAGLASRVKILARLNIAEQRLPQDGRIRIPVHGRDIDLRVSTAPTLHGESIALRILDRQELPLDFESLGFAPRSVAAIRRMIARPNGVVLVTGPTGSGKTTTLYAALSVLNRAEAKLFTVEDPVEYHLKGVNQIHVRPTIGLDFAAALRSILRQDPDILMIGEIRDLETARIAIQSALTGHLVLSTLHTNSAAASITRLIDMGVEDYLLVSCLRGIVAQRLVRKLCRACRKPHVPPAEFRARLGGELAATYFQPAGCAECHGSGYRGRTVIYEIMETDTPLCGDILKRRSEADLEALARQRGMETLFQTGMAKAAMGETSIDEVLRIVAAPVD